MEAYLERDSKEITVNVEYNFYPGYDGNFYEPDEPAEVEIISVTDDVTREEITLNDSKEKYITDLIWEDVAKTEQERIANNMVALEDKYDALREEQMLGL